ncbi:hypothetical protein HGM15179_019748 [Zosterops borbonicus]|uniref:Uncharacterized protein n=1 Tax=Zosterops borbonicus TaxID=364589 RepID=A0A8K1DA10_9PASS|nr:hypothetical protein HGM15179_019748 [Zosterops borbonicus]
MGHGSQICKWSDLSGQWDTDPKSDQSDPKGDQTDPKTIAMANGTLTPNPLQSDPNGQWDTDPKSVTGVTPKASP